MKNRQVVLGASLTLGLLLGLLVWRQITQAREESRHDLWLAYLRGPLQLYDQGSRQGATLLMKDKPGPGDRALLGNAVESIRESWLKAVEQQQDFGGDAFFAQLNETVEWHSAANQLAANWPRLNLDNADEMDNARQAGQGIHRALAQRVRNEWLIAQELPWTAPERQEITQELASVVAPLPMPPKPQPLPPLLRRSKPGQFQKLDPKSKANQLKHLHPKG
jgi:hypothetical protein